MCWCSKQDASSHSNPAHPHMAFSVGRDLTTLVQRCVTACVQVSAALCGRCCEALQGQHHLEYLYLGHNKVENEGAAAIAKAVKATVLTCGLELRVPGFHKIASWSSVTSWRSRFLRILPWSHFAVTCDMKEHGQPIAWHSYLARVASSYEGRFQNRNGTEVLRRRRCSRCCHLLRCGAQLACRRGVARCLRFVDQPLALRKILRARHCETHNTHRLVRFLPLNNEVRNVDLVVIFECVFGGSQCYVVCCRLGARNDLTGQSCGCSLG